MIQKNKVRHGGVCNPNTWEAETGGSLQIQGQQGLQDETLPQIIGKEGKVEMLLQGGQLVQI